MPGVCGGHADYSYTCELCPGGTSPSPAGATSLSQCKALGGYLNTGSAVLSCPTGTTSMAGSTQCTVSPGC